MEQNYQNSQVELPNSTIVLVLGIISIVGCCCTYGTLGILCGIIALVLAKSPTNLYLSNPGQFTEGSYKNLKAGKICAWIGLIPSIIYLILIIVLIATLGIAVLTDPQMLQDYVNQHLV
jgi:hypothetical protein